MQNVPGARDGNAREALCHGDASAVRSQSVEHLGTPFRRGVHADFRKLCSVEHVRGAFAGKRNREPALEHGRYPLACRLQINKRVRMVRRMRAERTAKQRAAMHLGESYPVLCRHLLRRRKLRKANAQLQHGMHHRYEVRTAVFRTRLAPP